MLQKMCIEHVSCDTLLRLVAAHVLQSIGSIHMVAAGAAMWRCYHRVTKHLVVVVA